MLDLHVACLHWKVFLLHTCTLHHYMYINAMVSNKVKTSMIDTGMCFNSTQNHRFYIRFSFFKGGLILEGFSVRSHPEKICQITILYLSAHHMSLRILNLRFVFQEIVLVLFFCKVEVFNSDQNRQNKC